MRKHFLLFACIIAAASLTSMAIPPPQAPVRNDNLVINLSHVRTGMCSPTMDGPGQITAMTPLTALLLNHNRGGMGTGTASCGPLLAPDGHQLTLGEYMAASGRAGIKCINAGTHSVLHFSDLLPNGTYSVWLVVPNPNAPPPLLGAGALGPIDPIVNSFTASEAGEGQISLITPEKDLSILGHIGPCFLDDPVRSILPTTLMVRPTVLYQAHYLHGWFRLASSSRKASRIYASSMSLDENRQSPLPAHAVRATRAITVAPWRGGCVVHRLEKKDTIKNKENGTMALSDTV